ncbi:MAG: hypothetical protein K0S88_3768, partial [Actinomycetia bacterium]|nr:hypothetical protein [Actinomycetes bacterium]
IDKQVVRQAGHRAYERMLECGVRIFEYQRTMLHMSVVAERLEQRGSVFEVISHRLAYTSVEEA